MDKTTLFLIAVLATAIAIPAHAEDASRFYKRKAEGWFWYEPEPVEPEETEESEPEPIPTPAPMPAPQDHFAEGPAPFSAAWIRENLQTYKDIAWDNPTIENVRAFLYLQRFAIDRSEQFADASEMAVLGDPFLDEIARRPSATFASQSVDRKAGEARADLLTRIADRAGLFFFFESECDYCDLQAPIIKMLEQAYGFAVIPISTDGLPLASGEFPNARIDSGHAEQLGVITYPATFLVSAEGEFAPLGQGMMSLSEISHRVLVAAKRMGWISDSEFDKSRPFMNLDNNIAEVIAPLDGEISRLEPDSGNNFVPPERLMHHIKRRLKEKY